MKKETELILRLKSEIRDANLKAEKAEALLSEKDKEIASFRENLKEAWSALTLIRETIEELGVAGSLKNAENVIPPTFTEEAQEMEAKDFVEQKMIEFEKLEAFLSKRDKEIAELRAFKERVEGITEADIRKVIAVTDWDVRQILALINGQKEG